MGIWGDGNLGYITAIFFKAMFPEVKLCIFGLDENKLSDFTFADDTFSITSIPDDLSIDHAFECVGGEGSPKALEAERHPKRSIRSLIISIRREPSRFLEYRKTR